MESKIEIKAATIGKSEDKSQPRREIKGCLRAVAREEAGRGAWKGMHTAGSDGR